MCIQCTCTLQTRACSDLDTDLSISWHWHIPIITATAVFISQQSDVPITLAFCIGVSIRKYLKVGQAYL